MTLAAIVFAFGLSFLGVWEIPVPGFVGTAGGSANGEGYGGAFSKGVLSTLLATPCSGPFLGSALAWAVVQPAYLTYAVFAFVGLGMASPYLLVGLFPRLVRLPAEAGQLDGHIQTDDGLRAPGDRRLPAELPVQLRALCPPCWCCSASASDAGGWAEFRCWNRVGDDCEHGASPAVSVAAAAWLSFGWLENVMAERFERAVERLLTARG